MMQFEIKNRWNGNVRFTAEIECDADASFRLKIGLAVRCAIKTGANLSGANLSGADLRSADLRSANLIGADLSGAIGFELSLARTRILPEGEVVGWKKCKNGVVVKLLIPSSAKRSHAFGRKCRAEFATVTEVFGADCGVSLHDGKTKYFAGETVTANVFDDDWMNECSGGIHFYITREEAEAHS
jgi:hypothetical protein